LEQIAALLELKGENPFKVRAYTNAARASRAQRWTGGNDVADIPVKTFLKSIDFPGTRKDVDSIIARYEFYQRRGHM
jgi:DNA polymerase/3'-5' exonuclease PolX